MTKPIQPVASPLRPWRLLFLAIASLSLAFNQPLISLVGLAFSSDLHSHTIVIPLVSTWLIWLRRDSLPQPSGRPARIPALLCAIASASALAWALIPSWAPTGEPLHQLTWTIAAYLLGLGAVSSWFLCGATVRAIVVPLLFLGFMVPMPVWLESGIETSLQHASAEATHLFFSVFGVPFLRDGQIFKLPYITMEIAQECSGIRSSLVLFIISIVAGQVLLPTGWRRWTLTLAVLPLAILRNGFRVFTLGVLCERYGPHMIHHWIHHRGGPVFFALSLIPFFALLVVLARPQRKTAPRL